MTTDIKTASVDSPSSNESCGEYPIYFYADKSIILKEIAWLFPIPAVFVFLGILLFAGIIGNESHVPGGLFMFLCAIVWVLILGVMFGSIGYWKIWHLKGPLIKLDRDEVTFYEWSDKPIPHSLLWKPFKQSHFTWSAAGLKVAFNLRGSQLVERGYPKARPMLSDLLNFRLTAGIRIHMPFEGNIWRFGNEYYKLHGHPTYGHDWWGYEETWKKPNL